MIFFIKVFERGRGGVTGMGRDRERAKRGEDEEGRGEKRGEDEEGRRERE